MDIVERLRIRIHTSEDETALTNEAADAIEKLREALVGLMKVQNGPPLTAWTNDWLEAMKKADAALQQNDSE